MDKLPDHVTWNRDLARRKDARHGRADLFHLPQFSPHIGAAIRAGKPFLRLFCPGCRQFGDVDLRKIVRPADFPIAGIYDALVCMVGCRGDGPAPEFVGLFEERDDPIGELRNPSSRPLA